MTGTTAPRIENKRQDDITKELKNDYKNYEKFKGYNTEMLELGKAHLGKMKNKIDEAISQLDQNSNLKEQFPDQFNNFEKKFKKYENEISDHTQDLNNHEWRRHHKEHLNKLGSIIDNYENDAIKMIRELVEDVDDAEIVNVEKGKVETANAKVKYVEIGEDGIYTLTKATNKPKIEKVLGDVLTPGEVWMIDYSECTNESIKTRMSNAISASTNYGENANKSYTCYLSYDQEKKTYVLSDGDGNKLDQRALIWEGVKLTPPSKIRLEARAASRERQQEQLDKLNNFELTSKEQQELIESMPEKMRNRLSPEMVDEFFRITEESLNERIKEAKEEGYELQANPISKYEGHGYLMKLNLINGNAETSKPLIKNDFSKEVRKAFSKGQLKKYLTSRVQTKWREFDHLTKRGSVIDSNVDRNSGTLELIDNNQKSFALKGLEMLGSWAEAVSDKIGNTRLKDDDREFAAIKNYILDAENDLNTQNITSSDIATIENKLTEMLSKFFKNNFLRSSMQISSSKIAGYVKDIISGGSREKQIEAMRKMGASRTWFDNSQTAFLRDEIFEEYGRKPKLDENGEEMVDEDGNVIYEEGIIDLKDDSYEQYFENINNLYQIDPSQIGEDGEIPHDKKEAIDKLYEAARTCTGKKGVKEFKKYLVNAGLLPEKLRGHGGQLDEKVRMLKMKLEQQEKYANRFEISGNDVKERTKQKLNELKLTLTSSQIQAAENGDDGKNDEGIARLNALNFMLQQDDSFFQNIATEETQSIRKTMKYGGVADMVRGSLAPYLIRRGGGINSNDKMAKIYNDSVGAGGWFDFSDEGAEKVGPMILEITIEVVITVVSILLSWNGAGEAIYGAYQAGMAAIEGVKAATKVARILKKMRAFLKAFIAQLAKNMAAQTFAHLGTNVTIKGANIATRETINGLKRWSRLAIRGTSTIVQGSTFYINNTMIHNLIEGEDIGKGLNPFGYEEGPDGEHIPNREGYARTIAFIGVLQGLEYIRGLKGVEAFTKNWNTKVSEGLKKLGTEDISAALKAKIPVNKATQIMKDLFKDFGRIPADMGGVMIADQATSLMFDGSFKEITGEDLVKLFGMVAGLRIGNNIRSMIVKEIKTTPNGKKEAVVETTDQNGNKETVTLDENGNNIETKKAELQNKINHARGELENSTDPNLDHSKLMTDIASREAELSQLNNASNIASLEARRTLLQNEINFKRGEIENAGEGSGIDYSKAMSDLAAMESELAEINNSLSTATNDVVNTSNRSQSNLRSDIETQNRFEELADLDLLDADDIEMRNQMGNHRKAE